MHDDILFHTNNWGQKVLGHFQDDNTGIIGVAGCHYFPQKLVAGGISQIYYQDKPYKGFTKMKNFFIINILKT
jgi:hypothetical protein